MRTYRLGSLGQFSFGSGELLRAWRSTARVFLVGCVGAFVSTLLTVLNKLDDVSHAQLTLVCVPIAFLVMLPKGPTTGLTKLSNPGGKKTFTSASGSPLASSLGWSACGWALTFGVAVSSASMRVSPRGDLFSSGGMVLAISCIALMWWVTFAFRTSGKKFTGVCLFASALVVHSTLVGAFDEQLQQAETRLAAAAHEKAIAAFQLASSGEALIKGAKKEPTMLQVERLQSESISIGTLSLIANVDSDNYVMMWRRRSVWDAMLPEQPSVEVASYLLGLTSEVAQKKLLIRRLSFEEPQGGYELIDVPTPPNTIVKVGSPVIIQTTQEPNLRVKTLAKVNSTGGTDAKMIEPLVLSSR